MKQTSTLPLAALLLSAATASAQATFRVGLRGGVNRASTTVSATSTSTSTYETDSGDKSGIYSWQAGVVFEASFGKFAFQPGLLFSQKGEQFHTVATTNYFGYVTIDQTSTNRYNWLELPLNVVYTLHGDHGPQLFAGPYVALAVGGKQAGTAIYSSQQYPTSAPFDFTQRVEYGPYTNNQRLDAGVNFGIGYRVGPVQVQLGYGLGLLNLHNIYDSGRAHLAAHNFEDDAAYNHVLQLTGTYLFKL